MYRAPPERRPSQRAPRAGFETLDVRTSDGWSLRADVHEPDGDPCGVAVLAHAMMTSRTEFYRPRGAGFAPFLAQRGWRVVTFDFRGHGESEPRASEGARYTYDDLVVHDLCAVGAFARSLAHPDRPVVFVGHSLGGHAGLAAQGTGSVSFDGLVTFAANVWLRSFEPSLRRWLVKRAVLSAVLRVSRRLGRVPARAVGLGSDDESIQYFEDLVRFARSGAWTSRGGHDYLESLARVRVPVLQVVSDGDRLMCTAECGALFLAQCGGARELVRVTRSDHGGSAPDHMGLITRPSQRETWDRVERWMRRIEPASGESEAELEGPSDAPIKREADAI